MAVLEKLKGELIVSCQGTDSDGNPFHTKDDMLKMAVAAFNGGAVGVRLNTPEHIKHVKAHFPEQIVVGIYKVVTSDFPVFITPTFIEAKSLIDLGCEIIAIDGTDRINKFNQKGYEVIHEVKSAFPDQLIMADLATIEDARKSVEAGADIISTTLSGYTEETKFKNNGNADFELIKQIRKEFPNVFINAEGRLWSREDVKEAFDCGADVVTVGTAITSPLGITRRFVEYIKK